MIYDGNDNEIDRLLENENKIVLKIQREERQRSVDVNKIDIKIPRPKKQNYEMLNEIKEIDLDLDKHIEEQNKKQISLKNKTDELSKAIDSSRRMEPIKVGKQNFNDDFDVYNLVTNQSSISNATNAKKNSIKESTSSVSNNNMIALHPKNYLNDDELTKKSVGDRIDLSAELETTKVKSKKQKVPPLQSNYNDELYISHRGRDTNSRAQKNSATGKNNKE
jgi:hypothetical protein